MRDAVTDTAQSIVEVSVCSIALSDDERRALSDAITPDERARMARFHHDADARRFLVGRATLRRVLAAELGVAPRDVPLTFGAFGKPVGAGELCVNVSHSGDVVLVAAGRGVEIGIDVERIDERHASESDLDTFFSPAEIAEHLALPPALRIASFFHIWTSKEAILKALATGLSLSLQSFDVVADPRRGHRLLAARCRELQGIPLALVPIEVPSGHVAALAALTEHCTVRYVRR